MKYINLTAFILSLALGIFLVYINNPPPKVVIIYPTKDNEKMFQFRDKGYNCYQLEQTKQKCNKKAEDIPLQI
jgi:hypothetical protein